MLSHGDHTPAPQDLKGLNRTKGTAFRFAVSQIARESAYISGLCIRHYSGASSCHNEGLDVINAVQQTKEVTVEEGVLVMHLLLIPADVAASAAGADMP